MFFCCCLATFNFLAQSNCLYGVHAVHNAHLLFFRFLLPHFCWSLIISFDNFEEDLYSIDVHKALASVASQHTHTHNNNSLLRNLSFDFSTEPIGSIGYYLFVFLFCFLVSSFRTEWIRQHNHHQLFVAHASK